MEKPVRMPAYVSLYVHVVDAPIGNGKRRAVMTHWGRKWVELVCPFTLRHWKLDVVDFRAMGPREVEPDGGWAALAKVVRHKCAVLEKQGNKKMRHVIALMSAVGAARPVRKRTRVNPGSPGHGDEQ